MRKLGFGKRNKTPIVLPGVIVDPAQTLAFRRQISQVALANREACALSNRVANFRNRAAALVAIAEPPRIKIHVFAEATALSIKLCVIGRDCGW